jgi:uncharacterized protein
MRKSLHLFVVLGSLTTGALAAPDRVPQIAGIPGSLEWGNVPLDWNIGDGSALSITAGKKTDWFAYAGGGPKQDSSPRLLFKPSDDFVLSAKVAVDFHATWDAGGLALYANDSVWAKLCLEMTVDKHPAIVSVVTRGLSDDSTSIPVTGSSVYLKVAKAGQAIFFYASPDGQAWTIIRTFSLAPETSFRVGFSSQAPVGDKNTAVFTQIQYLPERVDLWKLK